MEEDLKMASELKLQREQQFLISQMQERKRCKQETLRHTSLMNCEMARKNY